MRWAAVAGVVVGLTATANAEDATREDATEDVAPAREHARRSATLYLGTTWAPGPSVPVRGGVDAALRLHGRGIAVEARVGVGSAASSLGLSAHVTAHAGASIGGALALGPHVVIAPMLAYDGFLEYEHYGGRVWVHEATFALPVAVVLRRGVVLEAVVRAGYSHYYGATDFALVVGPRIGLVL